MASADFPVLFDRFVASLNNIPDLTEKDTKFLYCDAQEKLASVLQTASGMSRWNRSSGPAAARAPEAPAASEVAKEAKPTPSFVSQAGGLERVRKVRVRIISSGCHAIVARVWWAGSPPFRPLGVRA